MKPAMTVSDNDNGTKIEIDRGELLAVKLSAQLGTGYGWKVVSENRILALRGEPEQVSGEGQKPGGTDYQTFKFKASEKGEETLQLNYIEAWREDSKPLKEFNLTVIVK
jgi:inhibitor of cysteine peptidase